MTKKTKTKRRRQPRMLHAHVEVPRTYQTWRWVCSYAFHTAKPDATMEGKALLSYARRLWRAMLWTEDLAIAPDIKVDPSSGYDHFDMLWPPRVWDFHPDFKGCPNDPELPLYDIIKERNAYFWRKAHAQNHADLPKYEPRRPKAYHAPVNPELTL